MSKLDDAIQKALEKKIPSTLVYTVITKNSDPSMSNINNTPVMAFIKEEDAVYAVEHLNKKMKELGQEQTYVVEFLNIFNEQFYK